MLWYVSVLNRTLPNSRRIVQYVAWQTTGAKYVVSISLYVDLYSREMETMCLAPMW